MQNPPAISIGGLADEEPVPVHDAERQHHACWIRARGVLEAKLKAAPTAQWCHERPPDRESAGHDPDRPSQGGRPRRLGSRDRERPLRLVRPAPGVDDLYVDQRVLGRHGGVAALSARHQRPQLALRAVDEWPGDPDVDSRAVRLRSRPGDDQPLGPAPLGNDLLRSAAWRLARHGRQHRPTDRQGDIAAGDHDELRRHGPGVRAVDAMGSPCSSLSPSS